MDSSNAAPPKYSWRRVIEPSEPPELILPPRAERLCFYRGGRLIVSYHTFPSALWRFGPSRRLTVNMLVLGASASW